MKGKCFKINSFIRIMDEEEDYFLEGFRDEENQPPQMMSSPVRESQEPTLRAFNPMDAINSLPAYEQDSYRHLFLHHKRFPGLMNIFQEQANKEESSFMGEIQDTIFEQGDWYENALNLDDLFEGQTSTFQQTYSQHMGELKEKVNSIHNKTFNSIKVSSTISQAFFDHFENFTYLKAEFSFLKNFEQSLIDFVGEYKSMKGPGPMLLVEMYRFWMSKFKEWVQEIWKYNEKHTLSFIKKNKDREESQSSDIKSNKSMKMMEEKRRPWKNSQLQILEKVIDSNGLYTQATLNKIALELNRTPASISSKVQKMIRNKKTKNPDFQENDNMTLSDRTIEVLKNYPEGLSRESVIERINEHYEMGYDMSWTKSVAQLLSSKPEFIRVKGTYGLIGHHQFDLNKKTFKDKVVNCLLKCPEQKGDIKNLVEIYISLYGKAEGISILSEERMKAIEASISKSLCRYDIFDKSNSKTLYKLRDFSVHTEREMDIESYLC